MSTAIEKQDRTSEGFLKLAKRRNSDINSATSEAIRRGKKEKIKLATKKMATETVYLGGVAYNISSERATEIRERNEEIVRNRKKK